MLIRKKQVREFLLQISKEKRGGKFTRVSDEVYDHAEHILRTGLIKFVHSHPSVGKTLKSD